MGLLDVSDHGPEPRGQASAGTPAPAAGGAEGFATCLQAQENSPEQSERRDYSALRKAAAARDPAGHPPADPEPEGGRALSALPSELPM